MFDKRTWAAGLWIPVLALGVAASAHADDKPALPTIASTTLTDRQQSATTVITIAEGAKVDGKRAIRYHVVYDSASNCHAVVDGTATFFSETDESGDKSEALPNGEWATTHQFRDNGANGLVKLGMDVDAAHPRFVDFALDHPSTALPKCIGPAGLVFNVFAERADLTNPLYKMRDKTAATYHNVVYDYMVDYPDELLVPGTESASGDGLDFAPKSGKADIAVWGKYASPDDTRASLLHDDETHCAPGKVSYEVNKPTFIAFSCLTPKGRIVYEKMAIHNDVYAAVRFEYDAADQATWGPVIKQMAGSLRIGPGPQPAKD
ncbi:hypothetical protein [Dyella terrae]|uniref:hypothetical protein n=1 Tax=Dyella terrae TaxID=522259 RepID=UPI001EFD1B18|nr:hypothetical protein [Dyella terrae]ULU24728.1 hypothetical protein DYST_01648 [Dyella terrae]